MRRIFLLLIILIATERRVHADTLELIDGRTYHGTIVRRSETRLYFRVEFESGARIVRSFALSAVKSVTPDLPSAASLPVPESPLAERAAPAEPKRASSSHEQILREAFELLDDGDSAAALRALQRLVTRAEATELPLLEAQCHRARGVNLDDLLADARVRAALRDGGDGFSLRFATPYEGAALGRRLEALQSERLAAEFDGQRLTDWVAKPESYDVLQPDAPRLVASARELAAIIGARLRFDARIDAGREERARLSALRDSLTRLVTQVRDLEGFTNLSRRPGDAPDPTAGEADRLRRETEPASAPAASRPASKPAEPDAPVPERPEVD